jgi:hypothetical protein
VLLCGVLWTVVGLGTSVVIPVFCQHFVNLLFACFSLSRDFVLPKQLHPDMSRQNAYIEFHEILVLRCWKLIAADYICRWRVAVT